MKPEAGKALGNRYRLVRQIAVGGMGEVWIARDESLAREIAIKVLKQEFVGNDDFLNRFRTEARNSASLSHANIAQLYDYGEQDGSAYLVMELVPGEPMSDLLERTHILPLDRLLSILAQTSRALHAAHVGGVVHRDIKPGNILLETNGEVKITDFGVSLAANQIPMTAAGMVMGTAQYLSPEQAIGQAATGVSDIYALGIVAYEAIAGKRPFTGKTPVDIAIAHVNQAVPLLPPTTDPELADIIMKMLAKDPVNRPRSAAALAHTFESIAARLTTPKAPPAPLLPTGTARPAQPAAVPAPKPQGSAAHASPRTLARAVPPAPPAQSTRGTASRSAGQSQQGRSGPPRPDHAKAEQARPTRSAARAGSVKPIGPHGSARTPGAPVRTQGTGAAPTRAATPAGKPSTGSLLSRIKALGGFTLTLIFIVFVVLAATAIRAFGSETRATAALPPLMHAQTVQFNSEQFIQPGLSSTGVHTFFEGTVNSLKIKDAKW